ncbi:DUF3263 domain-containing protein [Nocardioides sp. ChNu-99]|uniref:DUF3263 domain-containing protein n=1 Tax=Nocardioides sp. ChNu-99 TaxID=2839897 RepID=UPI002404AAD4|nr:DUF3263 domain-containing protein [Nocardioides sp. ChNu-99]MDF9715845.1 DUF3263 domain-containing protein [Nocardioides sp. ChNu-99]
MDTQLAPGISDEQRAMLELEGTRFKFAGRKDTVIREMFGLSPAQFAQKINWLLDQPDALRWDPVLVNRLRRLRDARAAGRRGSTWPGRR